MTMRLPRWLATLPLSLALHVAIVALAIAVLRTESAPTALILDLNAIVAGRDDGPGAGPTAGGGTPAPRAAPAAPARSSTRMPSTPAPPEPSPARSESARPLASEPEPAAAPERSPAPSQLVAPPGTPPTSGGETGVARAAAQASADDAARGAGGGSATADGTGADRGPSGIGGADGTRVAAVAPGTGGGAGTGVGNEYAAYLARLRQRVQESLRYPATARRRGLTGTVQLEIAIAADGAIAAVSVIASSSHEALDRAAVEAARSLPRAPFPADVRPRPLTVRLPVVFELQ